MVHATILYLYWLPMIGSCLKYLIIIIIINIGSKLMSVIMYRNSDNIVMLVT